MAKNDLICLGLIYSAPCHAYAIDEIIRTLKLNEWNNLSRSSIYNTLGKLAKEKYIDISIEQKGNMPQRKVYSISQKGKERLHDEIIKSMADIGNKDNIFYMGLNFYFDINKDEAKEHLTNRIGLIENKITQLKEGYKDACDNDLYHAQIQCLAGIKHSEIEIELIKNIINIFEEKPDYFAKELPKVFKRIIEEKI